MQNININKHILSEINIFEIIRMSKTILQHVLDASLQRNIIFDTKLFSVNIANENVF